METSPTGTVTFLFTDIVGSSTLWEQYPQAMAASLARHDTFLERAAGDNGGYIFKRIGDAFCVAFQSASEALAAALASQRALNGETWIDTGPLAVRMALHTGACTELEGDYFGPTVNRTARILAVSHGGQILLSRITFDLLRDQLPSDIACRDLGIHRLRDLTRPEHIYQIEVLDLPADFPPLRSVDFRPNNLPTQATSFIGREHELEQAALLLNNNRLLTFTGPSGTGKSRLALQVAVEQLDEFIDGVFYVPMSTVTDPLLVDQTIAANLDLKVGHRQNTAEALKEHLRLKQILLLLDNFEHVIAAAHLIGDLLNETPFLKIIVTSREPLHIYGEQEFLVPTLGLPSNSKPRDMDYLTGTEAVRLFIDRARAVNFEFSLTPEIAPDVAEICRRLDGLPLAIELAAARTKLFPPAILLKRLQHTLGELTGGPRDAPSHHQTLRNAIAWSYDWLSEEEQLFFRQLAVFRGGFTLEAAESICLLATGSPTIDLVESLLNKNMLRQSEGYAGEPRFSMLRTIHEYAREQLAASGDEDELRRRHLAYLVTMAEEANPHLLTGENTSYWHGRLAYELDNFRAALAWSMGADGQVPANAESGALLIGWMFPFLYVRGFLDEGRRWLELAIANVPDLSMARTRALVGAGSLAWQQGDYTDARPFLEEAVAAFRELDDKRGLAEATHWLGHLTFDQKRYWAARKQFTESLALYEELGDEDNAVILNKDVGLVAYHEGDYLAARLRFEEILEFYKRGLNIGGGVDALVHLGDLARLEDDLDRAEDNYRQAQQLFRENELSLGLAGSYHKLGQVAIRRGDFDLANSLLIKGLVMQQEAGNKQGIAESLAAFAGLALALGDVDRSARLFGATAAYIDKLGAPLAPADRVDLERAEAAARNQIDYLRYDQLWNEGCLLSLEEALELAALLPPLETSGN